jgi:hypothetical protein
MTPGSPIVHAKSESKKRHRLRLMNGSEERKRQKFAVRGLAQKPMILLPRLPAVWGGSARLRNSALDPSLLGCWSNEP